MRLHKSRSLLLALALLVGQWLVFAHGFQHSVLASDAACEFCVQAANLGAGAPPAVAVTQVAQATQEAPQAHPAPAVIAAPRRAYPIRGPPVA